MIVSKGTDFEPCPEGVHNAVCVDVVDLGVVDGPFGAKHKCRIVWEVEATMEDGRRFTVGEMYSASLHEKSNLHKHLKAWRGRAFTSDELKAFDLEKVVGVPCQLVVSHRDKDGTIYANVQTVIKAGATKLTPSGAYQRVKDRPADQQRKPAGASQNGHAAPRQEVAEEIPF